MASYGSLPFNEQIEFFLGKLNLPTERWDDIWQEAHDRAFVVAGAMDADLLEDLRSAVQRAIMDGTTLEQFRDDFDALVEKNGWTGWTGEGTESGRAWRTRVIYETNLRTSYAAGRYQQLQAIKARRPFWRYRHSDASINPRPEHESWDGLILSADDPWWDTHYPPNGWGCKCYVESLAQRDLDRLGVTVDDAPESPIDPNTGAPVGIDKGWGYAPGASLVGDSGGGGGLGGLGDLVTQKASALPPDLSRSFLETLAQGVQTAALLDLIQELIAGL